MADQLKQTAVDQNGGVVAVKVKYQDMGDGTHAEVVYTPGGGDASAANQATQITAEQAIQAGVGAVADAAATAGSAGSLTAKLRLMTTQLASLVTGTVLAAGSAIVGRFGLDVTTPGTTNKVATISGQDGVAGGAGAVGATTQRTTLASDDPLVATTGAVSDAAAAAGSTGSVSAKLRLITSQFAALIAQIPASLGIKTSAASLSVAPSSDGVFQVGITSASQSPYGMSAKVTPFGELAVTPASVPLFFDQFDSALDTTNRWTPSGTSTPVTSAGSVVMSLTAANSVSSVLISTPTFVPPLGSYLLAGQLTVGAQQTNPNAHRFYGMGVVTAYASATPLTDGFGFEVDLTGALNAVVYISGTRYVVNSTNPALITGAGSWATNMTLSTYGQTMTWPASGTLTVVIRYVNGAVFFYSSAGSSVSFDVPLGVASYTPAITTLPIRAAAITTPAVSTVLATTFTGSGFVLAGSVANTVVDANFPFRSATIKAASTAAATTDLPMVVALHPSSPFVVGTAATNLGKAEDAVAASGDTGIATWGVRRDTLTVAASATGDYNEKAYGRYGEALVRQYEKQARTYSAAVNVAAAAAATDIATVTGSATTTVFITKVIISGIQTTAGLNDILLVKRSTANSGGTSSAGTAIPHDSGDAAATATVLAYTANPTTGTPVGSLRRNYLPVAGVTSVVNPVVVYDFGERGRPVILNGIAQVLAVNLNGATIAGGTFDVNFEWYEI